MYKYFGYSNVFTRQSITRSYSNQQTHYDVLNLKPNCTTREIRNSFLRLSKQLHPDVKGPGNDPRNTAQFVKVMEAYNVLSKRTSRELYDLSLQYRNPSDSAARATGNESWSHFHNVNPNPQPYYGVEGIEKVSNMKIVGILLIIAALGVALEFYLVRNSFTLRRDRLDEKSREAGLQHANVRAEAQKYGNETQLKRMTERILKASET